MHNNQQLPDPIKKMEQLCYKIFIGTQDGRELHQLLVDYYIVSMPVVDVNFQQTNIMAAMREGNNAMIRQLKTYATQHMQRNINEKTSEAMNGSGESTNNTQPFYKPKAVRFDV